MPSHERNNKTLLDRWTGLETNSLLIAEGKRALGREIVVVSDSKVDDGSGTWEDFVPASSSPQTNTRHRRSHTTTASASASQRRCRGHQQPDAGSISQSFSAGTSSLSQASSTPRRRTHHTGLSLDSSPAPSGRPRTSSEYINSFDSPEPRRARQRALMVRAA